MPAPTIQDRIETALEHLRLMIEFEGDELKAVRHLRGQIPMYIKGEPGAAEVRGRLTRCDSYDEMAEVLGVFLEGTREAQETIAVS